MKDKVMNNIMVYISILIAGATVLLIIVLINLMILRGKCLEYSKKPIIRYLYVNKVLVPQVYYDCVKYENDKD